MIYSSAGLINFHSFSTAQEAIAHDGLILPVSPWQFTSYSNANV